MNNLALQLFGQYPLDNNTVHDQLSFGDREERLIVRSRIEELTKALFLILDDPKKEMEDINANGLKHHHLPGIYVRELFIPKGTVMISKLHRKIRMWIIAKGEVTFRTELGARHVEAPYTEIVAPWSKVALFAHKDTIWFAICRTDETEIDAIETDLLATDFSDEVMR